MFLEQTRGDHLYPAILNMALMATVVWMTWGQQDDLRGLRTGQQAYPCPVSALPATGVGQLLSIQNLPTTQSGESDQESKEVDAS